MSINPLRIKKPIGYGYSLEAEDVLNAKTTLSNLGYYKAPKSGVTPWPDTPMFDGIEAYQKKNKLKVDGLIRPGGPTEKSLNRKLGGNSGTPDDVSEDGVRLAAAAAIPAIAPLLPSIPSILGSLGAILGLTLPLKGDTHDKGDSCDKLYYDVDVPTCTQISIKRGKEAGAKCFKSASERYAACLRGVPKDQLPPLDTWNN